MTKDAEMLVRLGTGLLIAALSVIALRRNRQSKLFTLMAATGIGMVLSVFIPPPIGARASVLYWGTIALAFAMAVLQRRVRHTWLIIGGSLLLAFSFWQRFGRGSTSAFITPAAVTIVWFVIYQRHQRVEVRPRLMTLLVLPSLVLAGLAVYSVLSNPVSRQMPELRTFALTSATTLGLGVGVVTTALLYGLYVLLLRRPDGLLRGHGPHVA